MYLILRVLFSALVIIIQLVNVRPYYIRDSNNVLPEPTQCTINDTRNTTGVCKQITACPAVIGLLRAGVAPTACASKKAVVCCPSNRRISAEKCTEYMNVLKKPLKAKGALVYNETPKRRRREDETSLKCEAFFSAFISGGRSAREREYPYQVALGYGNSSNPDWRCGGTLISENAVLTAAHCILTAYGSPKIVLLGDRKLSVRQDPTRIEKKVLEMYVHPEYKSPLQYNDIAIIKLESEVPISRAVLPACLPDPVDRLDRTLSVEVSGWGQTGAFDGPSDVLQSTFLKKMDTYDCSSYFDSDGTNKRRLPNGIQRSQFCAGDKEGLRDTCKGDSGGPATVTKNGENCIHYVVGITSFGSNFCGYQQPGVYTNTLSYLDWIENMVWHNITGEQGRSNLYTRIGVGDSLILSPSRPKVKLENKDQHETKSDTEVNVKGHDEGSFNKANEIVPVTTTPSTTSSVPVTTTPSTTSSVPVTTTPSTTSSVPVTTTPSTTSSVPVTATPSTTSSVLVTTTPSTTTSVLVTTTPSTTSSAPVMTTPSTTSSILTPPPMTTVELTAPPNTTFKLTSTSPPSTTLRDTISSTLQPSTTTTQIDNIIAPLSKLSFNLDGINISNIFNMVNEI
ncbi:unnamed protein product [Orchesella dallaii]|uniref:Serine protease snake n=1 Tax=Orchesella dallaii TaxID=48710 RepID=A0ABP1PXN8_9HEXA